MAILRAVGMGTFLVASLFLPGLLQTARMFSGKKRRSPQRKTVTKSLERLRKMGYITVSGRNDGAHIALTSKGRTALHAMTWDDVVLQKPKSWDGHWRVVLFDIPEERRFARAAFQQTLRRLGFFAVQRSIYVFPYPCSKEIFEMLARNALSDFVEYFETKSLGTAERRVRSFFGEISEGR